MDEWIVALEGSGLAHGPVNTIEKAFVHPQTTAGRMIESVDHESVEGGEIKLIGIPVKFSNTKGKIQARPPLLGEHTGEVLSELGFSNHGIEDLQRCGVI